MSDCSALRATFTKGDLLPRIGRKNSLGLDDIDVQNARKINMLCIERYDCLLLVQLNNECVKYIHEVSSQKAVDVDEYEIFDQRIFKITETGKKWAVPKAARRQVVEICHDEVGHFGLDKTMRKIGDNCWFAGIRNYVKGYINACLDCFYNKMPAGKEPGYSLSIEKVSQPMFTLHIDDLGLFVRSYHKHQYSILRVDAFIKFIFSKSMRNTKEVALEKFLFEIGNTFGYQTRIILNRGSAFTNKNFNQFSKNRVYYTYSLLSRLLGLMVKWKGIIEQY